MLTRSQIICLHLTSSPPYGICMYCVGSIPNNLAILITLKESNIERQIKLQQCIRHNAISYMANTRTLV